MKQFCTLIIIFSLFLFLGCKTNYKNLVAETLKKEIITQADSNLHKKPLTVTNSTCERSAGGANDFYSEGDYWWPNPEDLNGPYIRRDGLSNPNNFTKHRKAMLRFSIIVGNLTSAYLLTGNTTYSHAVNRHLNAWFITDSTKMNPNLLYAQAIKGLHTGRGIGIIDAIHLIEVAQSVLILEKHKQINADDLMAVKQWFTKFTEWLTTHEYGLKEMVHPNNHGTCWNMQVAMFAKLIGNDSILIACRNNFTNTILPNQMAIDGSFPLELKRTKPYGYSLFNLDAMATNCLILSDKENDFWSFKMQDGRSIKKAIEYMVPFVQNKAQWPLKPDVMYWDEWPVAHPAFLFGAIQYNNLEWFELWKNNEHFYEVEEVLRNMPLRNPLLWLE